MVERERIRMIFTSRGEGSVMIMLSFSIMSFGHELVLNFILKWAHHSHFVRSFSTLILHLEHLSQYHLEMLEMA